MGKRKPIKKDRSPSDQNDTERDKNPKAKNKKIVYRPYTLGKRMGIR